METAIEATILKYKGETIPVNKADLYHLLYACRLQCKQCIAKRRKNIDELQKMILCFPDEKRKEIKDHLKRIAPKEAGLVCTGYTKCLFGNMVTNLFCGLPL